MSKIVCIDIGTYSIKSLLMETSFNKYRMIDFHETVFPLEYRDVEKNIQKPNSFIKEHMETNYKKLDEYKIYSLISGDHSIVKLIPFPFKDKAKIRQALNFELESYVPFKLDEWVVEHCIQSVEQGGANVMTVLANKNDVRQYLDYFRNIEFEPVKITTDSIVPGENYALINIGHVKTNITTIENGSISLVRSIPVGGYHLTKAIAKACNISYSKAEEKKHRDARVFSDSELQKVKDKDRAYYHALSDFCYDLTRLLKQSIYSLKIQDKGMISKIYLSGGTAKIRGLDRFISDEIKVPVSDCRLGELEGNQIGINFDKNLVPSVFATGLRDIVKTPSSDINFRKGEFGSSSEDEGKKQLIKRIASFSSMTVCILLALFMFKCNSLGNKEEAVYKEMTKILRRNFPDIHKKIVKKKTKLNSRKLSKIRRILKEKKGQLKKDIQLLDEIETTGRSFLDVLREMSTRVTNDNKFDIYTMEFGNSKILLEANAKNLNMIGEIVKSLEKNKSFKNVKEYDTKAASTGGGQDFKLRFEVE
jgi:type IV pilus assembly protein PilM